MFQEFKSNCLFCNIQLISFVLTRKYCNDSCRHKHKRLLKNPNPVGRPKIIKPKLKWIYQQKQIFIPIKNSFGFIYKITQISTGKIYIGKKNFYKDDKISNWLDYLTSSKELKNLIILDVEDFKAEVIDIGYSEKQLTWKELQHQEINQVFLNDDFNKKSFYKFKK